MRFEDVLLTALTQIRANKVRSFFTLLGIIVSVAFLVAVIALIQDDEWARMQRRGICVCAGLRPSCYD